MLSNRPTQQQLALEIDLGDVVDELTIVEEPQRGQSDSATMQQPSLAAIRRLITSLRSETATERQLVQRGTASLDSLQTDLMEKIVDTDNMMKAWNKVRRNAGAPGPDGLTVDDFPQWLTPRWPAIRQQLLDGTYRPAPARRKAIPKPDGSERLLRRWSNIRRLTRRRLCHS